MHAPATQVPTNKSDGGKQLEDVLTRHWKRNESLSRGSTLAVKVRRSDGSNKTDKNI